jgi:transposase, IS5 family
MKYSNLPVRTQTTVRLRTGLYRLARNFYKGIKGDNINAMQAAAGMNFKRMIDKWKVNHPLFLCRIFELLFNLDKVQQTNFLNSKSLKMSF